MKVSLEFGDIYQTWGRGLILNQQDYQNLDFDTGAEGVGFKFSKPNLSVNLIVGDLALSKSTTSHSGYNPRIPNYFIDQFIYGADFNHFIKGFNYGLSILAVEENNQDINHNLSNFRIGKDSSAGDIFLSLIRKESQKDNFDQNKQGSGLYLSNTNYLSNWSITTSYRSMKIDINDPISRDNLSESKLLTALNNNSGLQNITYQDGKYCGDRILNIYGHLLPSDLEALPCSICPSTP